jgi:hypothetical protein
MPLIGILIRPVQLARWRRYDAPVGSPSEPQNGAFMAKDIASVHHPDRRTDVVMP